MPIFQAGSINTTAIVVPDLYIQVQPPQALRLNGVPSNVVGIVGTASWGPLNTPVIVSGMTDYDREFGRMKERLHDAGTALACAVMQGAADFRIVRVSDGTDAAASFVLAGAGTFTAMHTGTLGSSARVSISLGSKPATSRAVVGFPGRVPEVFDNIATATFWVDLASALNTGLTLARPASEVVTFTPETAPSLAVTSTTYTLTNGSDGDAVTTAHMMGLDADPRTGVYSLRDSHCSIVMVADLSDPVTQTTLAQFGYTESCFIIASGPPAQTLDSFVSTKHAAGLDDTSVQSLMGDWLYFNDPVNQTLRLVSPQGFIAGLYGNLSPEQSGLNKPLYGIVGSQRTGVVTAGSARRWSRAELSVLFRTGGDIVTNPAPGGFYWALRGGFNSSTQEGINGDNHPRLVNYISTTLNAGMGRFVGMVITETLFDRIRSTLSSFLQSMKNAGQIQAFAVKCDKSNNPDSQTELDYVQADVSVRFNGINKKFLVNLEAGQTVKVTIAT